MHDLGTNGGDVIPPPELRLRDLVSKGAREEDDFQVPIGVRVPKGVKREDGGD